jgi:hypothetical protein
MMIRQLFVGLACVWLQALFKQKNRIYLNRG